MERNYYSTIGVPKTATADEIKKAYRKLAMKYHPDRNPGDKEAEAKFKEVQEAYDVLSDPVKRSMFDGFGHTGRPGRPGTTHPHNASPRTAPPKKKPKTADDFRREQAEAAAKSHTQENPQFSRDKLEAVQCQFFGGDGKVIGRNILVNLILKKNEVNRTHKVKVKKRIVCLPCEGYGIPRAGGRIVCNWCHGTGHEYRDEYFPEMSVECEHCKGDGCFDKLCPACKGEGLFHWIIEEVPVFVPANHISGQHIVVRSKGERGRNAGINGNLHVAVILV